MQERFPAWNEFSEDERRHPEFRWGLSFKPEDRERAESELRSAEIPIVYLPQWAPWDPTGGIVGVLHFGEQTVAFGRGERHWVAQATRPLPNGTACTYVQTPLQFSEFRRMLLAVHGTLRDPPSAEALIALHEFGFPEISIVCNAYYETVGELEQLARRRMPT